MYNLYIKLFRLQTIHQFFASHASTLVQYNRSNAFRTPLLDWYSNSVRQSTVKFHMRRQPNPHRESFFYKITFEAFEVYIPSFHHRSDMFYMNSDYQFIMQ